MPTLTAVGHLPARELVHDVPHVLPPGGVGLLHHGGPAVAVPVQAELVKLYQLVDRFGLAVNLTVSPFAEKF